MKDEYWAAFGKIFAFALVVVIAWWIISNNSASREIERLKDQIADYEDEIHELHSEIEGLKEEYGQ